MLSTRSIGTQFLEERPLLLSELSVLCSLIAIMQVNLVPITPMLTLLAQLDVLLSVLFLDLLMVFTDSVIIKDFTTPTLLNA
jgi:hypothetical protein